jgi:hypothetical protein
MCTSLEERRNVTWGAVGWHEGGKVKGHDKRTDISTSSMFRLPSTSRALVYHQGEIGDVDGTLYVYIR